MKEFLKIFIESAMANFYLFSDALQKTEPNMTKEERRLIHENVNLQRELYERTRRGNLYLSKYDKSKERIDVLEKQNGMLLVAIFVLIIVVITLCGIILSIY